ncbi:uncharacterized protein A4U43_C07F20780 [Asparagus officinalis]|uniref:Uncharacterized protein n=1 Tax=Asparagus officinalis TaxID=4686 RepID=A0A5P1EIR5_ASPOF|nr:uncharacterized protein A4U43_C07F20780 [Asparagus officinalis]
MSSEETPNSPPPSPYLLILPRHESFEYDLLPIPNLIFNDGTLTLIPLRDKLLSVSPRVDAQTLAEALQISIGDADLVIETLFSVMPSDPGNGDERGVDVHDLLVFLYVQGYKRLVTRPHKDASTVANVWPLMSVFNGCLSRNVFYFRDMGEQLLKGAVGLDTIQGNPRSRLSSLIWCRSRLLSSSIDGSVSEWDLFSLQQKIVLDSVGVSIWQMAAEPLDDCRDSKGNNSPHLANGHANSVAHSDSESSDSEDDTDLDEPKTEILGKNNQRLAIACDDGCIRTYYVSDTDGLTYSRSFPRVSGRTLSVAWSLDSKLIFSGSSDGLIRCWDATSFYEVYRITVGLGGLGSGTELCVWSLLFLRCGTLVSGDSTGSVQFWDSHHGTLLQAHTDHKGDVNALATVPGHKRVFSAGSDGKVILYMMSSNPAGSGKEKTPTEIGNKWVPVDYKRVHTHDVRALAVAVPITSEDALPEEKVPKLRRRAKPISFSYHKWAHLGVPMLISSGDDSKLFAYPAKEFTQFEPHDICPAPQRVSMQLVHSSSIDGHSMMIAQYSEQLDVVLVSLDHRVSPSIPTTKNLARIKSKQSRKIISSALSSNGVFIAYSDYVKPCLLELRHKGGSSGWSLNRLQLPRGLQFAHCMIFSIDSSHLMLAGHDRKIYVVDLKKCELVHTFVPQRKEGNAGNTPSEPPITRMYTSSDGQWLAAINCFGDVYVFNLEIYRQHWFISRLNGASVTAGGFPPNNSNVLVITTSANQVYVFDVEAKQLGQWSRRHTRHLPRRFQEFPGEVVGLSFPPSTNSTSVVVYSSRAMCLIDFGMPVGEEEYPELPNGPNLSLEKYDSSKNIKAKRKRKIIDQEVKPLSIDQEVKPLSKNKNFDFFAFRDQALFVSHLSETSLLVVEKSWDEVRKTFGAPVHRHIYGT